MSPSNINPRAAAEALMAWWELAGVDVCGAALTTPPAPAQAAPAPTTGSTPPQAPARSAAAAPRPADALQAARAAAAAASSIEELVAAIEAFDGCGLKRTAQSTVVHDGVAGAPILLVGEAPGKEEDETGRPFVGRSGQFLDRMLASIGVSRQHNLRITNAVYWRPPGNRTPSRDELAICAPFLMRYIALSAPKVLILAGGAAAQTVLETSTGILKLRGERRLVQLASSPAPVPAYAILHPAYLLRSPAAKAGMWKDLLRIGAEIEGLGVAQGAQITAP